MHQTFLLYDDRHLIVLYREYVLTFPMYALSCGLFIYFSFYYSDYYFKGTRFILYASKFMHKCIKQAVRGTKPEASKRASINNWIVFRIHIILCRSISLYVDLYLFDCKPQKDIKLHIDEWCDVSLSSVYSVGTYYLSMIVWANV